MLHNLFVTDTTLTKEQRWKSGDTLSIKSDRDGVRDGSTNHRGSTQETSYIFALPKP